MYIVVVHRPNEIEFPIPLFLYIYAQSEFDLIMDDNSAVLTYANLWVHMYKKQGGLVISFT